VTSLAFDPNANVLYGVDVLGSALLTIDPTTGAESAIGPLGFDSVNSLTFDEASDTLYGNDLGTGQLLRIDRLSGAATAVARTDFALRALGPVIR
jgi:sugar lactone lactonase YvrE